MKVPTPEKMSSGNWFIRLRLGGENINITAPTKTECIRQAQLVKAEYKAGKRETRQAFPTLGEAIDAFVDSRRNTLSPSSIRTYKGMRKNRLQDIMGKPLDQIKDWQILLPPNRLRTSTLKQKERSFKSSDFDIRDKYGRLYL